MSTTQKQIDQLKAKIAEAKFAKLTVPSVAFEGENVDKLTKLFNESFNTDFSIDTNHSKIINLAESNNEYKLFRTLEKFLTGKGVKTSLVEYDASSSKLSHLIENELEKAQVVLAAKDIVDSLQKIAEDITKIQTDSVMPIGDEIKMQFGTEIANKFSQLTKSTLDAAFDAVRSAKDQIGDEVARIQAVVTGEPYPTDLSSDIDGSEEAPLDNDLGDELGGEEGDAIDLDAALGGADEPPMGRVKKESRTASKKAVVESKKKSKVGNDELDEDYRRAPISEDDKASVAGSEVHGNQWDANLKINGVKMYTAMIGDLDANDNSPENTARLVSASRGIANAIKHWLDGIKNRSHKNQKLSNLVDDFEHRHEEDLDFLSEDSLEYNTFAEAIEEVRFRLNAIFDSFDYYRVLVN